MQKRFEKLLICTFYSIRNKYQINNFEKIVFFADFCFATKVKTYFMKGSINCIKTHIKKNYTRS